MTWLEPYPDAFLEDLPDELPGPEAVYQAREAISLAFITVLQQLPARQRAVLILRDVLGFHAGEAARIMETTEASVSSALKRARAALEDRFHRHDEWELSLQPRSAAERKLVERLTRAYETGDVDGLVSLLTRDVQLAMPPIPFEYRGRVVVARFLEAFVFRPEVVFRLVPTRANGHPAFGMYVQGPADDVAHANGVMVFALANGLVHSMTRFDTSVLDLFGLPTTLPG